MKVYCLSAFKHSGKDMIAQYLVESFNATRVSFADPLKDLASDEYGVNRDFFDDPARKESPILDMPVDPQDGFTKMVSEFMAKEFRTFHGKQPLGFEYLNNTFFGVIQGELEPILVPLYHTPRSLAILKGSTNRVVRSNYWVQKAIKTIKDDHEVIGQEVFVISDMRYKSEIAQLKEAFGDDAVTIRINRFDTSPSSDPSELDLVGVKHDYEIENKTTKEEAQRQMGVIVLKDIE